ncbi:GntR family transcriptional regulator, partial [Salmonella enterica subsp. enterica serovar Typhi]
HKVTEEEYAVISIQEHKSILQALELHDETLARQRMREHIIRSMENMLTRYVGDPSA